MVKLLGTFSRFHPIRVLVVGDLMLDTYTYGRVGRISPEAPVPVLHVKEQRSLPGGAGNVALGLRSLGSEVSVLGRIGFDNEGEELSELLTDEGCDCEAFVRQKDYQTPVKNRLIAGAQQLIRMDHEKIVPCSDDIRFNLEAIDVVAISDYGKGFLSPRFLKRLISAAREKNIPVIVDPKGADFSRYSGATLIKPNEKEAFIASGLEPEEPLEEVAEAILEKASCDYLMVTRSEKGIALFSKEGKREEFSAHSKEVTDVTGAGDTVLAVMAMAVGNGLRFDEACQLANIAASVTIEHVGCARVTLADIGERLLDHSSANKIFDEGHLFALKEVLKNCDYTVLGLGSCEAMTPQLFGAIQRLKSADEKLILYCGCDEDFLSLLTSLTEVDFIILRSDSLAHLSEEIHPKAVYLFEEGEIREVDHPKVLLSQLACKPS